jgi:putative ABC transport system ATP-binding protein
MANLSDLKPSDISTDPGFIRLLNLSKRYQEGNQYRVVLHEANATFHQGELVAILGKSGSGKSTLLNLISGIDLVDSGVICLGDQELTAMNEKQRTLFRRRNIGFIFQFFNLIPTLNVLENVMLPGELNGLPEAALRRHAQQLLESVGLLDRLATFPDRLSGGEQQRVAIARALINDPILLLADEPTGNLDEETGLQVLSLLDSMTRKAGKTMIMVTHSVEAATLADRMLYLREGKLSSSHFET